MKRLFIIMILWVAGFYVGAHTPIADFEGMKSREILEKIRNDFRPANSVTEDIRLKVVSNYAATDDGLYRDYFSSRPAAALSDLMMLAIVPQSWWPSGNNDASIATCDLHNILPANKAVSTKRLDYPPGIVGKTSYDNSYWKAGIGEIAGMETNFYEPADEVKGDIARIYMYVAAVYSQPLWAARGAMLYADGYYPLLTAYGRELLLTWHRSDPVDETELRRNAAIAQAQGYGNPFVEDEQLAEYVWGIHSDEPYGNKVNNEDPPVENPIMLKAVYSISRDGRIDFRSPYVDHESVWTFDGRTVSGDSMTLEDVTPGRYELTFNNTQSRGKLIITIEP